MASWGGSEDERAACAASRREREYEREESRGGKKGERKVANHRRKRKEGGEEAPRRKEVKKLLKGRKSGEGNRIERRKRMGSGGFPSVITSGQNGARRIRTDVRRAGGGQKCQMKDIRRGGP